MENPKSSSKTQPLPSVDVYFFCLHPDHFPVEFLAERTHQCSRCPSSGSDNWMYYCVECEAQGKTKCHFSARDINSHSKEVHEGRNVEQKFAAGSVYSHKVEDLKRGTKNKTKRDRMKKTKSCPLEFVNNGAAQHKPVPSLASKEFSMNLPIPIISSIPLLNPPAASSPRSPRVETDQEFKLHQQWAKLINFGIICSLARQEVMKLLETPDDKQQLMNMKQSFDLFLKQAEDVVSENTPAHTYIQRLNSEVVPALLTGEKMTAAMFSHFKNTSDLIQKELFSKGCGNFMQLGYCLMGDRLLYKGTQPKVFLNGMLFTLGLRVKSPIEEWEKLFPLVSEWCSKYGVKLLGEEVSKSIEQGS